MKKEDKIRLLIADDHQVILDGLLVMLDEAQHIQVIATAANGAQAIEKLETEEIDVMIMDIQMPVMDGYEAVKIVRERFENVKILVLSMHGERVYIERMYGAGIAGYLLKTAGKKEILEAIEKVHRGENYFSPEVTAAMFKPKTKRKTAITAAELTRREKEILKHIADGMTNAEIADKLYLSVDTVKTHRKNMMRKLNVNNTAALVKYAFNL
jgi:DNA-binding NarL/FixJ family response regulator